MDKEVVELYLDDIIPNRFQPREVFNQEALQDLATSIREHGIIQPIIVRKIGDKYEIIAGERRYKASTLAGLTKIPAIIRNLDDKEASKVALLENLQRRDLSPIEEARTYQKILEIDDMTQEALGKTMGKSQASIANKMRLLSLPDEVQEALLNEQISERHARALLAITNKEDQVKWLDRIIKERLTVRQLDLAIKDELNAEKELEGDIPKVNINPDIQSIINNAVDINTGAVTSNTVADVTNPVEESQEIPKTTNKFFNYLEDEEVNMSTTDEPQSAPVENNVPTEVFSFTPEFQNAPENNFEAQANEEIETLDDLNAPQQDAVATETKPDEPIFTVKSEAENTGVVEEQVQPAQVEEVAPTVVETVENEVEETPVAVPEPVVQEVEVKPEESVIAPTEVAQPAEVEEFIFDDEESAPAEEPQSAPVENNEPAEAAPVEESNVEPIPIMEGEGVVDPAAYYDTLDPDFIDKVKEYVGLDLKNAINSYRDLTKELNARGFNVTIDETDLDKKYYIEININKE